MVLKGLIGVNRVNPLYSEITLNNLTSTAIGQIFLRL